MPTARSYQRSFGGGIVSPEMFGRVDDLKYQTGLAECQNFIVRPQGAVERRAGTHMVREAKHANLPVRLIPFTFSTDQTMVIELGHYYARFHTLGSTLMASLGTPYEVVTPYHSDDLFNIHYVQSSDVMTLVHPGYPPQELRRYGALDWRLQQIDFAQGAAPTGLMGHATVAVIPEGSATSTYHYTVARIDTATGTEGAVAAPVSVTNNLYVSGNKNTLVWDAAGPGTEYMVYKWGAGMYGFIGRTDQSQFVDENIAPDMSRTTARWDSAFVGAGNYPSAVTYYEQRRVFGGTFAQPQNIWMTRSGTESDMSYTIPVRDDNRISFRVASREANAIRHLVPLSELLILTSSTEWRLTSINTDAITPNSVSVKPQSYIGASNVQPVIVNNTVLYFAARGGHMQEMSYNWQANGYQSSDLSLRATHLFDDYVTSDMAYSKNPYPVVWSVRSDGKLLGLTYVPEHQIGAWHLHTTRGEFKSCAVVAEGPFDILYVVVKRTLGGRTSHYIERMAPPAMVWETTAQESGYFVDCGLSRSGPPATTFSGLWHLNGETVDIVADGAVLKQQQVVNGSVTIEHAAREVHIGLPIEAQVRTLPFAQQLDAAMAQGRTKNVSKVWLKVLRSSGMFVGPSDDMLTEYKQRTTEPMGTAPRLVTDEVPMTLPGTWEQNSGQVVVKAKHPLPLALLAMSFDVSIGH